MRRIGAVIYDYFEMLDYFGPLQMFSMFREDFSITAVGAEARPIRASGGPGVMPGAVFGDGFYDILLVPGGSGSRLAVKDTALLTRIRDASAQAELVTSVCTGSAILACAGVLNGRRATTNKRAFDWVAGMNDQVFWQRRARWVEDGKFITSSGVSAGMDMSLAVIAKLLGKEAAKNAALWAEYVPNTDAENDPFQVEGPKT